MLNTEQIKMPQSKLQNTGYQPVEALVPLLPAVVQFLIVCGGALARSVCTKTELTGAFHFNSDISIHGFLDLSHVSLALRGEGEAGQGHVVGFMWRQTQIYLFYFTKAHW